MIPVSISTSIAKLRIDKELVEMLEKESEEMMQLLQDLQQLLYVEILMHL